MKSIFYVTKEAPGAWKNGSRVVKVRVGPGDAHAVGALATVVGSVLNLKAWIEPGTAQPRYSYFVEWDDMPGKPTLVVDNGRIELVAK